MNYDSGCAYLQEMTDAELAAHIESLDRRARRGWFSAIIQYPPGYRDAMEEHNARARIGKWREAAECLK
jgi:hypothetical protein